MKQILILLSITSMWAQTGTLRGRVVQTGPTRPVQGVTVTVSAAPDLKAKKGDVFRPWQGRAATDINGEYRLVGIPAGEYVVCAQLPDSLLLDTCDGDKKQKTLEIATKKNNEDVVENMAMQQGTLLYVVIEDATGRLTDNFQKTTAGLVRVTVKKRPAQLAVVTNGMALYRMTVPRNAVHDIEVSSPGYRFANGAGSARSSLMTDGRKEVHEVRVAVTGFVAGGR